METYLGLSIEEIEDRTREAIDALTERVEEIESELSDPLDHVERFAKRTRGKRMLDAGCGASRYVNRFVQLGMDYTGIDISPKAIDLSRKRNPGLQFEVMNIRNLKFPDGHFDGIWSCCSLGHEPKKIVPSILAEMRRVLVPQGVLFVILPYPGMGSWEFVGRFNEMVATEGYCSFWEFGEINETVDRAGFRITDSTLLLDHGAMRIVAYKR